MDFVRSNFGANEPLPVSSLFGWFAVCAQQTGQKVRGKEFDWQRIICTKFTSYKIHILTSDAINLTAKTVVYYYCVYCHFYCISP